ncbi:hypothetical protein TEHD86_0178 [Tetragenococcus halophilus subsp. halophilus]|nr:hypothetical protein TEH11_0980 [Tetragenococcus halophilus subsp. halophilus]GBD81456.1 hypothetical protein TEHD86_0178 [Tetragenococcus halophilus subsp. halophilus]GLL50734.1 hypothetical protein YA5_007070 [Tetragenococcus halophilus]
MLSSLFTEGATDIQLKELLICITASLILGMLVAFIHMYRNVYTKNFVITLAVLPVLVQSVIMLVNGNLGTGIAVLGAFSLIRFRSVAGGSREITSIFWSMGVRRFSHRHGLRFLYRCFFCYCSYFLTNNLSIEFCRSKFSRT